MGKLIISLAALYLAVTYYSVRRSSEPVESCADGTNTNQCFRPLVTSKDRLSLELWLLEELPPPADDDNEDESSRQQQEQQQKQRRQRGARYQWAKVESCQNGLEFDVSNAKTVFDATNGNCTLQLPDFSRRRCSILASRWCHSLGQ